MWHKTKDKPIPPNTIVWVVNPAMLTAVLLCSPADTSALSERYTHWNVASVQQPQLPPSTPPKMRAL